MATTRASRVHGTNLSFVTFCPFLYQTRTITTSHRHRSTTSASNSHHEEESTLTFLQRKGRDVEARRKSLESTITPAERAIFQNIMKKFGAKVDLPQQDLSMSDPVPFEGKALLDEPIPKALRSRTAPTSTKPNDTNMDTILSLFAPIEASESFSTFSSAEEASSSDENMSSEQTIQPPNSVRQTARNSLQHVYESLQAALTSITSPPDLAIWRILETEVLPLMTLLQPASSPLSSNSYQRSLASITDTNDLPSCITSAPSEIPILPLVTILYPAATLLVLRTYIAHLPASGFARALLPKIRSLGPASYLLAANTHLCNAVLHLHWTVYSDLRAVNSLLTEMRRNGVEYDLTTLGILSDIKARRREDTESETEVEGGRGYEWWNMKQQDDGWKRLTKRSRSDVIRQLLETGQLSPRVKEGEDNADLAEKHEVEGDKEIM